MPRIWPPCGIEEQVVSPLVKQKPAAEVVHVIDGARWKLQFNYKINTPISYFNEVADTLSGNRKLYMCSSKRML